MDLTVVQSFDVAFISATRGAGQSPWNMDEELQQRDQWQVRPAALPSGGRLCAEGNIGTPRNDVRRSEIDCRLNRACVAREGLTCTKQVDHRRRSCRIFSLGRKMMLTCCKGD